MNKKETGWLRGKLFIGVRFKSCGEYIVLYCNCNGEYEMSPDTAYIMYIASNIACSIILCLESEAMLVNVLVYVCVLSPTQQISSPLQLFCFAWCHVFSSFFVYIFYLMSNFFTRSCSNHHHRGVCWFPGVYGGVGCHQGACRPHSCRSTPPGWHRDGLGWHFSQHHSQPHGSECVMFNADDNKGDSKQYILYAVM